MDRCCKTTLNDLNFPYKLVGWTKKELELCFEIKIKNGDINRKFNYPLNTFVNAYEKMASEIEKRQCNPNCVNSETEFINSVFKNIENKHQYISKQVEWYIPNGQIN